MASTAIGGDPELPLDLGSAGDFVILAKTGISTVPYSDITGDMGVSPILATAITGFSLIMDASGEFSTSAQVAGKIYAPDYMTPTPAKMTLAISDMETAYTAAAGRNLPDETELMAGNISSLTLTPGLYKWSSGVLINQDVWLDAGGNADAVFIFQIAGNLTMASSKKVILSGGAQAKNIFWQVGGGSGAVIGTYAHFEGIVLTATAITLQTGASFNGKLLAQTRVNLDQNLIMDPDLIFPPPGVTNVTLTVISEHGTGAPLAAGLPPAGAIYTNAYGTALINNISAQETIGGTQYVNTGWSMTGNRPLTGSLNTLSMVHTNDAVLTWLWQTNYLLNASAGPGGGVTGDTNGFYAAGSSVTVTAVPLLGYAFAGWTGDITGPTNAATQTMILDQARTVVAHFSSALVTLEIVSAHGVATPTTGSYVHPYGTKLSNRISDLETIGGTQYVNKGWSMIGNSPITGSLGSMKMTLTNNAVLTWLWQTNYLLNASAGPGGGITGDTNGFYAAGSSVTVTAVPVLGYAFVGWTGDITGPTNAAMQTMTLDQARTVVAHFEVDAVITINYLLTALVLPPGAGMITGDTNGYYTEGSTVSITAGTAPGWVFAGWTGDVTGPTNSATQILIMDQDRTVTALFVVADPACGTPVTQGAFMELDLAARFTGANLSYAATSTRPNVMSASITGADKLRLEALTPGLTVISVTATGALLQPQLVAFPVAVVGHPLVLSQAFMPHEPWNPRFEQRFVIQNNTGNACPALGLRLLFSNIQPGIVIENQTGLTPAPDGRPMIEWEGVLPNGSIQELSVIYVSTGAFRPDRTPPTVEVQYILPNTPPLPDQEGGVRIASIRILPDGRVVLEFASVAGRSYAIDYMNDFPSGIWRTVPLVLYAGGNRTQWIDYGPPATLQASGVRVYRMREVSP